MSETAGSADTSALPTEWAVISANMGGYDRVGRAPSIAGLDSVMVTDSSATARSASKNGWRVVTVPVAEDTWLTSREAKFNPHLFTDRRQSVWVDARVRFTAPGFVEWAARALGAGEMAAFPHPNRSTIAEEATECHRLGLTDERVFEQVGAYESMGFPVGGQPLMVGMFIARRHTERTLRFGEIWKSETHRWRTRDQISLPFAAWKAGVEFQSIAGSPYEMSGVRVGPHRRRREYENRLTFLANQAKSAIVNAVPGRWTGEQHVDS